MSAFTDWNNLLLMQFFPPAAKEEEVWLHTTKLELNTFGLRLGGVEGLVAAVQEGPPWLHPYENIAEAAARLARQRKAKIRPADYEDPGEVIDVYNGFAAPAYLPYIALWVLASSESSDGFYANVARMSCQPFPVTSNSIREQMLLVWTDLESWTSDCGEEFGSFVVRVLGSHQFVGIPRSQCLISKKDQTGLPLLFVECGLRKGQSLGSLTYAQISSRARTAHCLSNGLREAFADSTYAEPLKHMVSIALQNWDGKVPHLRPGDRPDKGREDTAYDGCINEVAVVLRPGCTEDTDWDINWRIPVFWDGIEFSLVTAGSSWKAVIEEIGTHASTISSSNRDEASRVLALACHSEVEFKVSAIGDESVGPPMRMVLPNAAVRTLVWDVPDPNRGSELIEGQAPLSGACFLLFDRSKENFLTRIFAGSRAKWETFRSNGLPHGWEMGCLHRCELLTPDERQAISESPELSEELARIRLVGGRTLNRGSGRTYPFYDLPVVELEAPNHARILAEGLELTRLGTESIPGVDRPLGAGSRHSTSSPSAGTRRYGLRITDERRAVFQIRVIDEKETLASTTLKVSVSGGQGLGQGRQFGVDSLGQTSKSDIRLLGVLRNLGGDAVFGSTVDRSFDVYAENWTKFHGPRDLPLITDSVSARFLDSLAHLGSIAFGTARDQVLRLAYQSKMPVSPPLLLLELRGLGYLEIETDDQGHMTRVHAVPPTLYTLPLQHNEQPVRAICGTLRLQHWNDIGDCLDGLVWLEHRQNASMPAMRFLPTSDADCNAFIELAEFTDSRMPSSAIADWASGLDAARSTLSSWGWETLMTDIRHSERFHPGKAEFVEQEASHLSIDPEIAASLHRFEDPTIHGLRVYVFGTVTHGRSQYSFLQDSRWGIWLALSAFAQFVKREIGIGYAVPWPIHYEEDKGTFLLPARLRPPFVLERALLFCSGSTPVQTKMLASRVSPVYGDMGSGIWLAYRWVPKSIARKIAGLLGGVVTPLP